VNVDQLRTIGIVVGAHGLQGSLKVESLSDFPERFGVLQTVFLVQNADVLGEFSVKSCRWSNKYVILTLREIQDRVGAEAMRSAELCVRGEDSWPLPANAYYTSDLIGFNGVDEHGDFIGQLIKIIDGAQAIFEFERADGSTFLVPFVNEWVGKVDTENRRIGLLNWKLLANPETIEPDDEDDH
jgi:16S rRNA processing protein RimM